VVRNFLYKTQPIRLTLKKTAMKKLIAITCGAIVLHVCSLALAQNQQIASAESISSNEIEKTAGLSNLKTEAVAESDETGATVRAESANLDDVRPSYQMRYNFKKSSIDGKVGPNGEEIFLNGSKYYYIDSNGKKVKVNKARLKDKPKHS